MKKWVELRDGLRRTRLKRKTKSGQTPSSTTFEYEYEVEDVLEFLVPPRGERRKRLTKVQSEDEDDDDGLNFVSESQDRNSFQPEVSNEFDQELSNRRDKSSRLDTKTHKVESATSQLNSNPEKPTPTEKKSPTAPKKVRSTTHSAPRNKRTLSFAQANTQQSPAAQLLEYLLSKKESEKQKTPEPEKHPVDAFLAGIAPTIKSYDPFILNEAKSKIYTIVQDLELKQLSSCSQERIRKPKVLVSRSPSPASSSSSSAATVGEETASTNNSTVV